MTKAMLDAYQKNKHLIRILTAQLRDMEAGGGDAEPDRYTVSDTIMDYRNGYARPVGITGFNRALYDRRRMQLEAAERRKISVELWISGIEDDLTRKVFELYYLEGKTWIAIAQIIKPGMDENYPRIAIRDKYLKEKHIRI